MFLSKLFKSKTSKWLTALGAFAMAMGVGAALSSTHSAFGQENAVVETKAATTQTWTGATSSLFFVPNYTWKTYNYDSQYIYPYLYIQWNNGAYQNAPWPGVKWDYSSNQVFRFDNVPLTALNQLTIVFNNNLTANDKPRLDFSSTSRNAWYTAGNGQTANVFGAPGNDWYTGTSEVNMGSGLYTYSDSETLIAGSIYHHNANWGAWPTASNVLTGSSPYEISFDFIYGDEFKAVFYPELNNTSSDGNSSSWALYNDPVWKSYTDLTFTIYDDAISTTTAVASGNVAKYISNDNGNVKINHAGRVKISNTSKRGTAITLRWAADSSRTFSPSATLPGTVPGTFNSWSVSGNPISWNPATGRYETMAAVMKNDGFKFYGTDWMSVSVLTNDISSGATTGGGGGEDWIITSNTGYYAIGWYYQNTTPSGTPTGTVKYFVDKTHYFFANTISSIASVSALCQRISLYTTCDVSSSVATNLQTLYSECTYGSKNTYMNSYSIDDYSYSEWSAAGKKYDDLEKTIKTNAKTKYDWLLYMGGVTDTRPSGIYSVPVASEQSPLTVTLWVVLGSGLAGLAAIGSAYFISKRKKRNRA